MELSPVAALPHESEWIKRWRAYRAATVLGWKIGSNWTQPHIFFIFSILKPISAAIILVVMVSVVSGGRTLNNAYLPFVVIGGTFWGFVSAGLSGFAIGVAEDRGRYRTLKYVYMAPRHYYIYMLGRATALLANAAISVLILMTLAVLVLRIPINPLTINYPLLLAACALNFAAVVAVAMAFGTALLAARDAYGYGEIAAQVLYIVSGAIFPLTVLPGIIQWVGMISPFVYWMELSRRALMPGHALLMLGGLTDGELLLRLAACTAGSIVVAHLVFNWADHRARRMGLLDQESQW
ncbi:MAG: ABC transporter permease [Candidatus Dormibacteria bacterium]